MSDSMFRLIPLIRNSERESANTCLAQWNWRWNMGLVPAMPRQDARWFGSCWHLVWAEVYTPPPGKDGFTRAEVDPHEIWKEATQNTFARIASHPFFCEDDEKEWVDAVELGHLMIDGQLREWNLDPGFEVLMPEQRFKANIPFNDRQMDRPLGHWVNLGYPRGAASGGYIGTSVGTFDLTCRDHTDGTGKPTVLDWKTTRDRRTMKQMNKDNQFGLYMSVGTMFLRKAGLIKQDESIERGIISFARKAKPDTERLVDQHGRFRNKPQKKHYIEALRASSIDVPGMEKFSIPDLERIAGDAGLKVYGEVSKNQGSPLFWRDVVQRNKANRARQISRLADDIERLQAVRSGVMPVNKSPGDHCNWCDFSDLCDIDEDGGDTEQFIKDVFKIEDPYADHQEGARNSKESVAAKRETKVT